MSEAPGHLLDLPADRRNLHALAAAGLLDPVRLEASLAESGHRASAQSWTSYLYWHALIIGVVLFASGAIFFVAANWAALAPMVRIGIVAGCMVSATLVGGFLGDTLAGRSATLLGGLLFGPLLVVYSQVYQTGADAWQLFALWTLVMFAFAVVARFSGTWVVVLVLFHIAGLAWIDQELGSRFYAELGGAFTAALGIVDLFIVVLAERWAPLESRRIIARTAASFGLLVLMPFGLMAAFGELETGGELGAAVLAFALLAIWAVYRWRRPDVVMLSYFAVAATTLVSAALANFIFDDLDAELFGVALLGGLICLQVWGLTRWLLRWRAETQSSASNSKAASGASGTGEGVDAHMGGAQ